MSIEIPAVDFKHHAATPRVTRSRFVVGRVVSIDGKQFADGRLRFFVPEETTDEEIAHMETMLEADDREQDRMDALMEKVRGIRAVVDKITEAKK